MTYTLRQIRLPVHTDPTGTHCHPKCIRYVRDEGRGPACRLFGRLEPGAPRHPVCVERDDGVLR